MIRKLLKDSTCSVIARTPSGGSALLIAVEKDRLEIVKLLVKAGADVKVLKPNGAHALILAAEFCKRDGLVIEYLISCGLGDYVNRGDEAGDTAMAHAAKRGNTTAMLALKGHGGDPAR